MKMNADHVPPTLNKNTVTKTENPCSGSFWMHGIKFLVVFGTGRYDAIFILNRLFMGSRFKWVCPKINYIKWSSNWTAQIKPEVWPPK